MTKPLAKMRPKLHADDISPEIIFDSVLVGEFETSVRNMTWRMSESEA